MLHHFVFSCGVINDQSLYTFTGSGTRRWLRAEGQSIDDGCKDLSGYTAHHWSRYSREPSRARFSVQRIRVVVYWSSMRTTDLREDFFLLVASSVGSREQFLQSGQGSTSFSYFLIGSCTSELLSIDLHLTLRVGANKHQRSDSSLSFQWQVCDVTYLHDKAFVMAATALWDQLVFEASSFLIQLHDWVLTTRCQNRTLSSHLHTHNFIAACIQKHQSAHI